MDRGVSRKNGVHSIRDFFLHEIGTIIDDAPGAVVLVILFDG